MPLRIVLYPNNEVACHATVHRAVSQCPEPSERDLVCGLPLLDIRRKLEQKNPDAIAPSKECARPGYGSVPKGADFGLRARRRVRRLSGVFDHLPGDNLFITLTLPGSTLESFETLSAYSSEVVHRYKVWLCQQAKKFGVCNLKYLYVWELQKRGALHLHLVINCPSAEFRDEIQGSYHARWFKLLGSLSDKTGVDLFRRDESVTHSENERVWQSDCQLIDGYIGAYLGKYLSKGSENQYESDEQVFFPTRWWGASQGIRDSFSEMTESFHCDGTVEDLCSLLGKFRDEFSAGVLRDHEYLLKFRLGLGRVLFINPDIYTAVGNYIKALDSSAFCRAKRGPRFGDFAGKVIAAIVSKIKILSWGEYQNVDAKNRETISRVLGGDECSGRDYLRLWRSFAAGTG